MTRDVRGSFDGHTQADLIAIAREEIPDGASPGFAAVSGSHLYGWASEQSDVDLRGFHIADGRQYALLDRPDEQVSATFTSRDAAVADIDFVSYELRTFGVLLADRNFNALETLFEGQVVLDSVPADLDGLRTAVEEQLPMDVPARYAGMAESNRDAVRAGGSVKRCLYAVRGLLAAQYVAAHGEILVDIRELSRAVLGETALVDDLIAAKVNGEADGGDAKMNGSLSERVADLLDELAIESWGGEAPPGYRTVIDSWMRVVRDWEDR